MVSPVIRAHQGQPNNTVNVTSITCTPSRATYLTTFTYRNGSRSVSYNANYIGRLADMIIEPDWMAPPPCYTGDQDCASPFNWTQSQIDTIAGYNHYTIIQAFVNAMQGSYNMTSGGLFVYDDDPPVLCRTCNPGIDLDLLSDANLASQFLRPLLSATRVSTLNETVLHGLPLRNSS